ncbi:hypothetical protein OG21DRAFT_1516561, partial [Imleria badia]
MEASHIYSSSAISAIDVFFQIPPIPYFSKEEEDYFVERFSRQGFDHCMFFH